MKLNKVDPMCLNKVVAESISLSEVLVALDCKICGGNYATLKKMIVANGISIEHFTGQAYLKSKGRKVSWSKPLDKVMVENSDYYRASLKKRLIDEGILDYKCAVCKINEWMEKPLTLALDHINGKRNDNRLENLRLLCPNCHSQTETYGGKNNRKRQ